MGEEHRLVVNLFLVSMVALAFETTVFRVFTFLFGYHFVSLLVALALLGYGISGSLAKKIPRFVKINVPWILGWSAVLFVLGLYFLPLDPYGLWLAPLSLVALVVMLLITLVPFFFHGLLQVFSFERFPFLFSRFYGFNLIGSAAGVGLALWGLSFLEESRVILLLALVGITGRIRMIWRAAFVILVLVLFFSPLKMYISPYSPSRLLREIPENVLLRTYRNPVETMEVFSTPSFRMGWGLSVLFTGVPPSSFTLVFDRHATESFPQSVPPPFLEALLLSLPFRITQPEKVLVIEGKSGLEVYLANHFGGSVVELVTASFLFASFLRDFIPDLPAQVFITSPRRYLGGKKEAYDCITVHVPVGRASVFPGSFSFVEDFLFTREGIQALFAALNKGGVLVFPIFLQNPPSLLPKLAELLATVWGRELLSSCLVVIKSLDFALLLVKKEAWEEQEIAFLKQEVLNGHFDFIYFPGGQEKDFERIFQTGKRYYRALREVLEQQTLHNFFDLRPARDHRPYFKNFFRFSQLTETWRNLGRRWLPFGGAGFLLFVVVFAIVTLLSVVGILFPLRGIRVESVPLRRKISLASICAGMGFMFMEIALFVRLSLVIGLPLYTFSLLLVALLLGAGWGSARVPQNLSLGVAKRYTLAHLVALGGYFLSFLFFGNAFWLLFPLFPLAYLSGVPFPLLSQKIHRNLEQLFPLAFAYNGFFSVISALLAHFLLVFWGMELVFGLTFLAYSIFWLILLSLPE